MAAEAKRPERLHTRHIRRQYSATSWQQEEFHTSNLTWPLPQKLQQLAYPCSGIAPSLAIKVAGFADPVIQAGAERYQQIFFAGGAAVPPPTSSANTISVVSVTVTTNDTALRFGIDESYSLVVNGSVAAVTAATPFGALWALETLSQLISRVYTTSASGAVNSTYYQVCPVSVTDAPRFPYRGLLIDTSRHFMTVSAIKSVIDMMAYMRMNALHIHFTDDQSWPLYIPALPQISNVTAFSPLHIYTPGDIAELVQFARNRGVVIVPEIDFPEHSATIIEAIPAMGCFVPDPSPGYRCLVDPLYPRLWSTLKSIWQAMDAVFPKEYPFHMGGDEVEVDCWANCPSAIAWAEENGISDTSGYAQYAWFERSLYGMLAGELNRTVMAWEDITGFVDGNWSAIAPVASNLILQQWDGSPGTWNWDTCAQLATGAGVVVAGPFTILSTPAQNYVDIGNLTCPPTSQLLGPEIMLWDDAQDTSGSDVLVSAMQTILAVSESGWSATSTVSGQAIDGNRYAAHRCRMAMRGIASHPGPYSPVGTFCLPEYEAQLAPWSLNG